MVRLAQFSSSEYHSAWGEPGDQRKGDISKPFFDGEVNIVEWGARGWTALLRPIDINKGAAIAKVAEQTALNPMIGYSQNNGKSPRTTFYECLMESGGDASKIKEMCNADCSSGWSAWCNAAGIRLDPELWTGTAIDEARRSGQFFIQREPMFTAQDCFLLPGDALIREPDEHGSGGHIAVVIDIGDLDRTIFHGRTGGTTRMRRSPGMDGQTIGFIEAGADIYLRPPVVPTADGRAWILSQDLQALGWVSLKMIEDMEVMSK